MNSVFFVADPKLIDMSKSAVDKLSTSGKVVWGRMVTGESFITDESRQKINDEFALVLCQDFGLHKYEKFN